MVEPPMHIRWLFALLVWLGAGLAAWAVYDAREAPFEPQADTGGEPQVAATRALRQSSAVRPGRPEGVRAAADAGEPRGAAPHGPRTGRVAWRYTTGGRITGPVAVDREGVYLASHDGVLRALDHAGRLRWQRPLGAPSYSGVARDALGRLYLGTEDGAVHGFTADGARLFRRQVHGTADRVPVPTPGGGVLFVAGRRLLAFSPVGGLAASFEAHRKLFTRPALAAAGPVVGSQDHFLYALGWGLEPRWRRDLGTDVDGAPALAPGGTVLAGTDAGQVYAFGPAGEPRWVAYVGGAVRAPLLVTTDGRVLAQAQGVAPAIVCLDVRDGSERFRFRFGLEDTPEAGSRAAPVADAYGTVYAGGYDDRVVALDPHGRLLFEHHTRGHVHADLVLAPDGTLYVGADDGVLYALKDE